MITLDKDWEIAHEIKDGKKTLLLLGPKVNLEFELEKEKAKELINQILDILDYNR